MVRGDSTLGRSRKKSNPPPAMKKSCRGSKGINRGHAKTIGPVSEIRKREGLIHLTLDCNQGCIDNYNHESFRWEVEVLRTYKTMPTILKRKDNSGRTIICDLTYHGPGNQFVDEFPDAVSEYHFIGFCYYEDNPDKKGNFNAKIIPDSENSGE